MVAYCKETFNGTQSVINYLGKYIHRIAISNYRIKSMTEATVTYAVKKIIKTKVGGTRKQFGQGIYPSIFNACSPQTFCQNPALWFAVLPEQEQKDDAL